MELKRWMDVSGMTQKRLGEMVGCHEHTIYRIVNYISEPSATLARKIIDVTNGKVTLKDLTDWWLVYKAGEGKHG